jgi:predicted DNA-binding transcriptional regulator YafY
MVDNAISRVARAMDIIPYVLENPGISIEKLAAKFGVNQKQIIKDLELIFLCGLPGYTPYELIDLTLEDGLVTIIDPQLFNKPRKFTETEGVIITLGLSLLKKAISGSDQIQSIDDLMNKLSAKFKVSLSTSIGDFDKPAFYDEIVRSISKKITLTIEYNSISEDLVSYRSIKPMRVSIKNGFYYLFATDLEIDADRIYRIDQIKSVSEIESEDDIQINKDLDFAELIFEIKVRDQLITERYRDIFTEVKQFENHFLVKGRSSNRQWLYRWILSHCSEIEVIEPQILKDSVKSRAQSALSLYQL